MSPKPLRSIFISDTHLGHKNAQAEQLLTFLNQHPCQTLFLLGDIIDLWKMRQRGYWPDSHQRVLNKLFAMSADGTRVVYIPGNHDPFFRQLDGLSLGHIEVHQRYIHTLADGKRMLLVHGDCFDPDIHYSPLLHKLGDAFYDMATTVNRWITRCRHHLGLPYWSPSTAIKLRSKKAQAYINAFEQVASTYAQTQDVDGIICGHIHQAKLAEVNGIIYANDGDWVESCSALLEDNHGALHLEQLSSGTGSRIEPRESASNPVLCAGRPLPAQRSLHRSAHRPRRV